MLDISVSYAKSNSLVFNCKKTTAVVFAKHWHRVTIVIQALFSMAILYHVNDQ